MTKKIGLALSGAVARGPAHLGVLEGLLKAGIPIDVMSGTSAGALIGAMYCAGFDLARAKELAAEYGWSRAVTLVWPRRGFVNFNKLEQWIVELVGDIQLSDLKRPMGIVATDLETGEPTLFREGRLARLVHATCAVPGFVEPVEVNGRLYGDGGISNNLPVAAARALGADFVIGVDLFRPTFKRPLGPLGFGLGAIENMVRRSGGGLEAADCLISPELTGVSYFDFGQVPRLIELGRQAAEAALPTLQAQLIGI